MDRLTQAVESVRDRSSLYWAFYEPESVVGGDELIEVRLNGSTATVQSFRAPTGWSAHRVQSGKAVFLRRNQPLTDEAVEAMLIEMLRFAGANGMQLHSWMHGPSVNC